jgi:hypothetical protein
MKKLFLVSLIVLSVGVSAQADVPSSKIIQITFGFELGMAPPRPHIIALCADGSVWDAKIADPQQLPLEWRQVSPAAK